MEHRPRHLVIHRLWITTPLLILVLFSGCLPPVEEAPVSDLPELQLATASVSAQLPADGSRTTVIGHNDNRYFVDSERVEDGILVVDTLLAAQSTCAVFVAEKAALELDITLEGAIATSVFDEVNRQVEVYLDVPGAEDSQVLELANHLRQRCPIYTTLSEAESIDFTPGEELGDLSEDSLAVSATIFEFGKANVTAGDNTFIMDSVPPLNGPNLELNPLDMMLGGLAACSSFIHQSEIPTMDANVKVEGDFDPSGVRDLDGPNPRIRNMRIILQGEGYEQSQFNAVANRIQAECDLYSLLNGTVNIEILEAQALN